MQTDCHHACFQAESLPNHDITIQIPIHQAWETEVEIYRHLICNYQARAIIYRHVNEIRYFQRQTIILHHPLLRFPLTLHPHTSDIQFGEILQQRLDHRLYHNYLPEL
jgi:hypothetical protein